MTVAVDFFSRKISIASNKVNIQCWDTAGQEIFKSVINSLYKNKDIIFLVYDVSNPLSFHKLYHYLNQIDENCQSQVTKVLFGNKKDLQNDERVDQKMVDDLRKEHSIDYFQEISAKEDDQLDKFILDVVETHFEQKCYNKSELRSSIVLNQKDHLRQIQNKSKSKCICQ